MPSPQVVGMQALEHASALLVFPSSHCSGGRIMLPVPLMMPPVPLTVPPVPVRRVPVLVRTMSSPQMESVQMFVQVSLATVFPSSHSSTIFFPFGFCFTASPQIVKRHCVLQRSALFVFPSSHSSGVSTVPLPQVAGTASFLQRAEQPSPFTIFPSSHSSPASRTELPQTGFSLWQIAEQPSLPEVLPSSHCSPLRASTMLSPQAGFRQSVLQRSGMVEL